MGEFTKVGDIAAKVRYFLLNDDGDPVPLSREWTPEEAAALDDHPKRRVAYSMLNDDTVVSTVFVGMSPEDPPQIYETRVSCRSAIEGVRRYPTRLHALLGHSAIVRERMSNGARVVAGYAPPTAPVAPTRPVRFDDDEA